MAVEIWLMGSCNNCSQLQFLVRGAATAGAGEAGLLRAVDLRADLRQAEQFLRWLGICEVGEVANDPNARDVADQGFPNGVGTLLVSDQGALDSPHPFGAAFDHAIRAMLKNYLGDAVMCAGLLVCVRC